MACKKLKKELNSLKLLLEGHAEHEEKQIHLLLKRKNSPLYETAEREHQYHALYFKNIEEKFINILSLHDVYHINQLGYEIYLDLRKFFAETLLHLDYEEKVLMPELQQLYTDGEIKEIDYDTYQKMIPEQMNPYA